MLSRFVVCSLALAVLVVAALAPVAVGAQTPAPDASGRIISGSIPTSGGFGIVVFGGGSYDQLVTASGCPAARVAFWVTQGGAFIVYVPTSMVAEVNAPFERAFPNRSLLTATALVGRCTSLVAIDARNATYEVAGRPVTLVNGLSEVEAAPGSASKVTTRYFGNEASGDLNGDGVADVGLVLTQSTGGSGTFYYAAAVLTTPGGQFGTNAVLLGDRIAPQTTEVRDGTLIVNYAERRPGEPMTARPSVGVSKSLRILDGRLVEPATLLASITLPDGTACRHVGLGAPLVFQVRRVTYTCGLQGGQETVLVGAFSIAGQEITVTRGVVGQGTSGFVLLSSQRSEFRIERLTLLDGTSCAFAGSGATLAFAGKRVNYTCTDPLDVLLGDFSVSGDVVSVARGTVGRDGSGFVLLSSAPAGVRAIDGVAVGVVGGAGLTGTSWRLVSLHGNAVVSGTEVTATFVGGRVSGSSGCNSYGGGYRVDGNAITMARDIVSTLRGCEAPVMAQEAAYFAALLGAVRFSIVAGSLTIETSEGDLVFIGASV